MDHLDSSCKSQNAPMKSTLSVFSRLVVSLAAAAGMLIASSQTSAAQEPNAEAGQAANASVEPAAEPPQPGGEANLKLPDLNQVKFLNGAIGGKDLLYSGIIVASIGLVFGLMVSSQLKKLPVHKSMLDVSELIYETCKTYLLTQGRFLAILWLFIGAIIVFYFQFLLQFSWTRVLIILAFSVIGILGSYLVAWFGIRVNTYANSRTAFASLTGRAFPCYAIPLKAGISIGMLLISVELLLMLIILMFIPGEYAGPCFIGFAIGESLGAAALRVAGGFSPRLPTSVRT